MITWIDNKKAKQSADVSICLIKAKDQISIRFSSGATAVKLRHCERIIIGIDDNRTRLYIAPYANGGYKCTKLKSGGCRILISCVKFRDYIHPSELCGTYEMHKDAEGNWFISIGAARK